MQTVNSISALREATRAARAKGQRIGFVPTMGNLHQGHLNLLTAARKHSDFIVSSIFINPLQFNVKDDLERYPRTLEEDQKSLIEFGCDLLFAPTEDAIYPLGRDDQTAVEVPGLSDMYCGASRPRHFRGVTTIVNKLFNLVQPDLAVFGKKDFQQLHIIRRMVDDLSMPIQLLGVDTAREPSGLALSSRNGYLTEQEREVAPELFQQLTAIKTAIINGSTDFHLLIESAEQRLEKRGFRRDYIHVLRQEDLQAAGPNDKNLVIIAAAYLGHARLIDNLEING